MFCCEAKTQTEYITNGSFEQIDSCYGCTATLGFDVFEWSGCKGWSNPIYSSSDLWCTNGKICLGQPPFIPGVGYQFPRTGNNMAGILINGGIIINYREYIENKLTTTLQSGKRYELSFYLSSTKPDCSPVELGIKFYNTKFYDNTKMWLTDIVPDAINDYTTFVVDTLDWQLVTIPFTANGNENYVVIGNFEDSTKIKHSWPCDTMFWNNIHYAGNYFFIDDVSIIEAPYKEPIIPNVFTPNNDHVNDVWRLDLTGSENVSCVIYNRWGLKIYETHHTIIQWDGRTSSGIECVDGMYYYIIETKEKTYKGFMQLIR